MYYELIVYSSVCAKFNSTIVKYIESKEGLIFSYILSNEFCPLDNSKVSLKTLDIFKVNRKIDEIICIDSSIYNYLLHPDNIVPLSPFLFDSKGDRELPRLSKFLVEVASNPDPATEFVKKQVYSAHTII